MRSIRGGIGCERQVPRSVRAALLLLPAVLLAGPAGCGTQPASFNNGVLVPSVSAVNFGDVAVGTTGSATVTLTNNGTSSIQISAASATSALFSVSSGSALPATIVAGGTYSFTVKFTPNAFVTSNADLTVTSSAPTAPTTVIPVSGRGTPAVTGITCASSTITGPGSVGCTLTLNAAAPSGGSTVTLSSSNSIVSVPSTVTVPGKATSANFTATVSAVTTSVSVIIKATLGGVYMSATLQLSPSQTTGSALAINATSVSFGTVTVNTTSTQSVLLASTGTTAVTVSAISVTGAGFSVTGVNLPLTLNPGASATLYLQFAPTTSGSMAGQLAITSNSISNSSAVIPLSGTGTTTVYTVNLSWQAPTSSTDPVVGYDIYRLQTGVGSYQLLTPSTVSLTSYSDGTVIGGQSYTYYVTSVDAAGNQSAPSNTTTVTIP